MSRELRDKAENVMKELKEMLEPLSSEINKMNQNLNNSQTDNNNKYRIF